MAKEQSNETSNQRLPDIHNSYFLLRSRLPIAEDLRSFLEEGASPSWLVRRQGSPLEVS